MATASTLLRYSVRKGILLTLGGTVLPLCGCATGSSASFTQAPLLFAEQTDTSGTAADPARQNLVVESRANLQVQPVAGYVGRVGTGGNASLPTAAVTAITRPLGDALSQVATALPVSVNVAPAGAVVAAGPLAAGVSVQVGLSSGTIVVDVQTGAVPPINVQANVPDAVGATVAAVTQVATNVPVVSTVLQSSPVAVVGNAAGGTLATVGSTTTALLQPVAAITSPIASIASKAPVAPAATAAGVAQSVAVTGTSLLTGAGAALAKICVLKGCR